MTQEVKTTIILKPSEGKHIKNIASGDIFEGQVYLGCNDKIQNYIEVSEEEYQEYISGGDENDN